MKTWITLVAVLILLATPVSAQETGITVKPQSEIVFGFLPDTTALENAGLLHIVHEGVTIVSINMRDGSVVYGEGYAADDAALLFWEAVGRLILLRGACDAP
ncbi:hypothetical protein LCGC14_1826570 [marine sediment metagenome]|uniref:Uncharacterized protein n=1 Tax=marine sediment metagenome TaxID=412755 RepID=A0A0F9JGV0_9ZZZZ